MEKSAHAERSESNAVVYDLPFSALHLEPYAWEPVPVEGVEREGGGAWEWEGVRG